MRTLATVVLICSLASIRSFESTVSAQLIRRIYISPVTCKYKDCWAGATFGYSNGEVRHGDVHIVYSTGKDVRTTSDGLCGDTVPDEDACPKIAPDQRTAGWTVGVHQPCVDWSIRGTMFVNSRLVLFRNGKVLHTVAVPRTFIEDWQFINNGKQVAIRSRWHHGASSYRLFDLNTGHLAATFKGWVDKGSPPVWAHRVGDFIDPNTGVFMAPLHPAVAAIARLGRYTRDLGTVNGRSHQEVIILRPGGIAIRQRVPEVPPERWTYTLHGEQISFNLLYHGRRTTITDAGRFVAADMYMDSLLQGPNDDPGEADPNRQRYQFRLMKQ